MFEFHAADAGGYHWPANAEATWHSTSGPARTPAAARRRRGRSRPEDGQRRS